MSPSRSSFAYKPRAAHAPKRMSDAAVTASALAYLARFSSSSGNLRRVLARKVKMSAAHHGDDPAPLLAKIEPLIAHFIETGVLDDALYAETQARKMRRRGGSTRVVVQRLAAKGLQQELIAETVGASPSDDRRAAAALARRRRLGPYRADQRPEHRSRDLAALGRAGFDYQTATAVIDAGDLASLTEWMIGD